MMMTTNAINELTAAQRSAIITLSENDNELFFLLYRKAGHLACNKDVRIRDIMREFTLSQVHKMVTNSGVAKGTELYPYSEDEDEDYDPNDYPPPIVFEDEDSICGEMTRWEPKRNFGIITVDRDWSNAEPSADTYFFHIDDMNPRDMLWQQDDHTGQWVYFYEHYDSDKEKWCAKHGTIFSELEYPQYAEDYDDNNYDEDNQEYDE